MQAASDAGVNMAAFASIAAGAIGAGSSLMGSIADTVMGAKHLELQRQQLELNKQSLIQNKELTEKALKVDLAMPFLNAKAQALVTKGQMEARYDFYKKHGADDISLLALSQGKVIYSSGATRQAQVKPVTMAGLNASISSRPSVPILMDVTRKPKTSTASVQVGHPGIKTPGKSTQTETTGNNAIGIQTNAQAHVSTQIGFPFVFDSSSGPTFIQNKKMVDAGTSMDSVRRKEPLTNKRTASAQTSVSARSTSAQTVTHARDSSVQTSIRSTRSRMEQKTATERPAFYGVGLNGAIKPFYRSQFNRGHAE